MDCLFLFSVALNIFSSVGLIFENKIIFEDLEWKFATCLTAIHFLCNYLACELLIYMGLSKSNRTWLPMREAIPMALCWATSIIFANLSLLENTTGFYQASKLLSSPVIVVWQFMFFGVVTDRREIFALIPLIAGIALITDSDLSLTYMGAGFAVAQLIASAAVQTWVKAKQLNSGLSATELLRTNSLICFFMTLPIAPLVDYGLLEHQWIWDVPVSTFHVLLICVSGLLALGMNIACFLIIGYSDPLTFQVVGYAKTLIIFVGGAYIFNEGWRPKKIIGMCITVLGLVIYRGVRKLTQKEEKEREKKWSKVDLLQTVHEDKVIDDELGLNETKPLLPLAGGGISELNRSYRATRQIPRQPGVVRLQKTNVGSQRTSRVGGATNSKVLACLDEAYPRVAGGDRSV